jgi:hypothetical protein
MKCIEFFVGQQFLSMGYCNSSTSASFISKFMCLPRSATSLDICCFQCLENLTQTVGRFSSKIPVLMVA